MKKIICFTLIFASFLMLSAESLAFAEFRKTAQNETFKIPIKFLPDKRETLAKDFTVQEFSFAEKKQKELQPNYCTTASMVVVDSNQVKVTYDFWIVKVLKKLFGSD